MSRRRVLRIPTGSVTVKAGPAVLCVATLSGGQANCPVAAVEFPRGTVTLLAVSPGPTTTTLSVSPAVVTYGHEQAARLGVKVRGKNITATGSVTVLAGSTTVCVITLKSSAGTCTLSPRELRPGTYGLASVYAGSASYEGSTSAKETLTVR